MDRLGFEKLGYISMVIIYGSQGGACLFSNAIINRVGQSKCMLIGSLTELIWIICCVIPIL